MEFDQREAGSAIFGWPGEDSDGWSQLANCGILIETFIVLEQPHSHCFIDYVVAKARTNTQSEVKGHVHDVRQWAWADCPVLLLIMSWMVTVQTGLLSMNMMYVKGPNSTWLSFFKQQHF